MKPLSTLTHMILLDRNMAGKLPTKLLVSAVFLILLSLLLLYSEGIWRSSHRQQETCLPTLYITWFCSYCHSLTCECTPSL